jgi:peptidoglycan lytic transglycosylase G
VRGAEGRRGRGAVTAVLLSVAACGVVPGPGQERVTIPPGASLPAVADSLVAHQVISSRGWFRLLARVTRRERRLQAGTYALRRGEGSIAALRALTSGHALLLRLTVPEGFTLLDIAGTVERELSIPRDSLLAAARDTALQREFAVPGDSFEGFLRPETYLFAQGVSADRVIREMATTFRAGWDPSWDDAARARRLDRRGLVTLASIVEAEARADSDRALIAAVLLNRIERGMPLQADATILYAMQLATGERKARLYEKDYAYPSPYNTYQHPGLPPGPIGAPSRKSLEAVAYAPPAPYLYYVVGPDGRHVFSRTYAEHLRAVQRMRRR